ncbi:ankyrin [Aspergillus flavus]|nr:ankyrin [Aspergillus flavus]
MPKRGSDTEEYPRHVFNTVKRPKINHDDNSPWLRLSHHSYTVGWICAVDPEHVAATVFLDEEHEGLDSLSSKDNNTYTLGRIGGHNVVIAVMPNDYGTTSASLAARDMLHSFPNIRTCVMVGIGGGAPSPKHDIRLGDVVVSSAHNGNGGVWQYDFGKRIQDQSFQSTGFLNQPPLFLQTAVKALRTKYAISGHRLQEALSDVLEKHPRIAKDYKQPNPNTDRLYKAHVIHPNGEESCAAICGDDLSNLVERPERQENPVIHYGLIASANQVMKDATVRDTLAENKDVLCFEMEAAGLMNHFPCLVIRGICDYADTHKNKEWQGYAAMAAAAYAKDLLSKIPVNEAKAEKRMADYTAVLHSDNVENREISASPDRRAGALCQRPREAEKHSLNEQQKCELLNSLHFDQIDARHLTIKKAHAKTCRWLLRQAEYRDWLDRSKVIEHNGFLWIKGKPGAGKSTLMKFALDNARRVLKGKNNIIIAFFFNARGDKLERSTLGMYRSLLLQLLERLPELQDVFESLELAMSTQAGRPHKWVIESLKELFEQAVQRLGQHRLICFIDALDECAEDEIRDMISFLQTISADTTSTGIEFYVCLSSRHYPHITIRKGITLVLEGQEGHRQDITNYLDTELNIGDTDLAKQISIDVQNKALGVFMWVVLVVGILNKEYDSGNVCELKERLRAIPGDLHQLFRDILTRDNRDNGRLLLCIQWVLFAKEPLRREQLYFAIHSGIKPLSAWGPDITPAVMDRYILDCSKGLAEVTKGKTQTVQFIHESVNDFLLRENGLMEICSDLGSDFQGQSHERLKQCCLTQMTIAARSNLGHSLPIASSPEATQLRQSVHREFPFLEYAIQNVLHHGDAAEGGGVSQLGFIQTFQLDRWIPLYNLFEKHKVRRYTPDVSLLYILAEHNLANLIGIHPSNLCCFEVGEGRYGTPIFAALATNSGEAVRAFLTAQVQATPPVSLLHKAYKQYYEDTNKGAGFGRNFTFRRGKGVPYHLLEQNEEAILLVFLIRSDQTHTGSKVHYSQTLLSDAAKMGWQIVVKWLIENGAELESKNIYGRTPLSLAARSGYEAVCKLLLEGGAELESKDIYEQTPLSYAAGNGYEAVSKLLLKNGAEVNSQDSIGSTPLTQAAGNGYEAVSKLLLENGAEVNSQDSTGSTPLTHAVRWGHEGTVKVLLAIDWIDADRKDHAGRTPLYCAVFQNRLAIATILLMSGKVNVNSRDNEKRTPLCRLLEKEETFTIVHHHQRGTFVGIGTLGYRPIFWRTQETHEAIARLLVDNGADVNMSGSNGRTPLSLAAERSNDNIIKMLLEKGAAVEAKDNTGRTPLSWAAESSRNENSIRILLERGAEIESKDDAGRTPLSWAAGRCKPDAYDFCDTSIMDAPGISDGENDMNIIKMLLQAGANVESKDINGRTPLSWAAQGSSEKIPIQVLPKEQEEGLVNLGTYTSTREIRDITELLLKAGADLNAKDHHGRTPLRWATDYGNEKVVKLLESAGAIQ